MFTNLSLKLQITWLTTSLIILTTIALSANYGYKSTNFIIKQLQQQVHFAQNVLTKNLKQQEQVLITAASVLTADFGFKQAVATKDTKTIQSVLSNHSKRIDASLMVYLDLQGSFIASNDIDKYSPDSLITQLKNLPFKNIHAQVVALDNDIYQIIVIPVRAPNIIGYTIVGFQFTKEYLIQLKNLLSLDITLLKGDTPIQSSLSLEAMSTDMISSPPLTDAGIIFSPAEYFHQPIPFADSNNITAVLSASLQKVNEDTKQLLLTTLLAAFSVLFFAITLSRLLAKRLTTPLLKLNDVTKLISVGNFDFPKIRNKFSPEFSSLYHAFETMGRAIKQRQEKISYQAEHDLLTSLYNRQKLLTEVENKLRDQRDIVVFNLNIRGFSVLNDTIGMTNGDAILTEIAVRLRRYGESEENASQIISSRTHSDEFIVALEISSREQIASKLYKLRQVLEKTYLIEEISLTLHFYYGIANSIDHGSDSEKLIRRATLAASHAIQTQKVYHYYKSGEDEAYLYKLKLIEELKTALEKEDSPLFLNFQPKLNLATKKVDKVEVLIRWINNKGEFVNPELFVALAEQSGLIVKLTQWVINKAIKQAAEWNQNECPVNAAINLSAQDIQHDQFIDYLVATTAQYKVNPNQITLELTERDIADNELLVDTRLRQLKTLGFEISVDDYGIGQSSLSKLKSLPVDELKIDKCFILALDSSKEDQYIVSSTIELGHKLGLRVVAEGVENKESLSLLEQYGCDYIQGYYLSKPIKADQFLLWYKEYA